MKRGEHRSLGSRLLSGGIWMMGSRGVQAVCGILVSMLLARMLSPEEMGTYFILSSITLLGSMLAQFGTHQAIVKLIAGSIALGDEPGVRRSLRSVLMIAVCGSAIVAGSYIFGGGALLGEYVFKSQGVALLVGLTALWIVLRNGQMILAKAFRGFHNLRLAALYEGAQTQLLTVIVLAILWFTIGQATLDEAVKATVVAFALTFLSGGWLLWRHHWSRLAPADGMSLGLTLRLSSPLFVSSFSLLALAEVHLWILGSMSTPEQVAIYGAGFRLMKLVQLPLTLVNQVIPPMVAELFAQQRKEKLEQLMRTTASVIALPALLLLVLILVFSVNVLGFVYGDYFRSGAAVLAIMAVGQAINVLTGSPGVVLAMSDQQNRLMRASVGGGVIGLLITFILVQYYGAVGVAIGYACGLAIQNIVMAQMVWWHLGIKTFAGIGQLRNPLFWLRGELLRRANKNGLYGIAERLLQSVENVFCSMVGIRIVECFGDSHANIFSRVNRSGCMGKVYFRATVVQGATAFGLANSKSRTNALKIFSDRLTKVPVDRTLLFLLGEVDTGYLVWKKAEKDEVTPHAVLEEALHRYFTFLETYYAKGHQIILVTVPLPAVRDQDMGHMEARRPGLKASQRVRTDLTLVYNARLRRWADERGVYMIDLDSSLLDPESNMLRKEYYKRSRIDNHLEPETFTDLLCCQLSKKEFTNWLWRINANIGQIK